MLPHEIPKSGRGGTSGPGTYKYFKFKNVAATLKFDATKKPPPPQPRSRGVVQIADTPTIVLLAMDD